MFSRTMSARSQFSWPGSGSDVDDQWDGGRERCFKGANTQLISTTVSCWVLK